MLAMFFLAREASSMSGLRSSIRCQSSSVVRTSGADIEDIRKGIDETDELDPVTQDLRPLGMPQHVAHEGAALGSEGVPVAADADHCTPAPRARRLARGVRDPHPSLRRRAGVLLVTGGPAGNSGLRVQ